MKKELKGKSIKTFKPTQFVFPLSKNISEVLHWCQSGNVRNWEIEANCGISTTYKTLGYFSRQQPEEEIAKIRWYLPRLCENSYVKSMVLWLKADTEA